MKFLLSTTVLFLGFCLAQAQSIDHWETIVEEGASARYLVPTSEPNSTWIELSYDDTSWPLGISGIGYGDNDDNTVIETTISAYLRIQFSITDIRSIEQVVLSMDYDDAFVAYLNGIEIARSNISGEPPTFDQASDGLHEATLYQGVAPGIFEVDNLLLNDGNNILAVQVHNESLTSSDLSAIPVLSAGINNSTFDYNPTPWWFTPPSPLIDFTESKLPIVVIDTQGQQIYDEPKVHSIIGIIYNGQGATNYMTDPFNEFEGHCGIEFRGESSQGFPKKSYGFETWDAAGNDIDTAFLNFPSEEDFILHGPYSDKSLMNNVLAMKLANEMGHYSSRTRMVELVINDEYKGIYVLMEKIKHDKNRVDIATLNINEISGDDLTGGYIFRIDKGSYDGWQSRYNVYGNNYKLYFQYYYPDQDDIVAQQKTYIQNYMHDFEDAIASSTFKNAKGKHYLDYIDLRSFVDNFILNELTKDVDAYRLSTYFHKDKDSNGGKVKAGPFWDFNLSLGNGDYCSADDPTGWQYYQCVGNSPFWWDAMLQDAEFRSALRCRWNELRNTILHTDTINNYLDSMTVTLAGSSDRNFERWPILGTYIWPNPWYFASATSHDEVMNYLKEWVEDRSIWLDNNIMGVAENCEQYEPPNYGLVSGSNDEARNSFGIYPNPAKDQISIVGSSAIHEVSITNTLGQIVFQKEFSSNQVQLDLSKITTKGLYLVSIRTAYNAVVKRLIIE